MIPFGGHYYTLRILLLLHPNVNFKDCFGIMQGTKLNDSGMDSGTASIASTATSPAASPEAADYKNIGIATTQMTQALQPLVANYPQCYKVAIHPPPNTINHLVLN